MSCFVSAAARIREDFSHRSPAIDTAASTLQNCWLQQPTAVAYLIPYISVSFATFSALRNFHIANLTCSTISRPETFPYFACKLAEFHYVFLSPFAGDGRRRRRSNNSKWAQLDSLAFHFVLAHLSRRWKTSHSIHLLTIPRSFPLGMRDADRTIYIYILIHCAPALFSFIPATQSARWCCERSFNCTFFLLANSRKCITMNARQMQQEFVGKKEIKKQTNFLCFGFFLLLFVGECKFSQVWDQKRYSRRSSVFR